jgi:hypothetical protein
MKCPLFPTFVVHDRAVVAKYHFVANRVDLDPVALCELPFENLDRQRILNQSLYGSFQGPGTVDRIVTLIRQQCFRSVGNLKGHFSAGQVLAQPLELDLHNRLDFFAAQAVEDDNLIDSVQELGLESVAQVLCRNILVLERFGGFDGFLKTRGDESLTGRTGNLRDPVERCLQPLRKRTDRCTQLL